MFSDYSEKRKCLWKLLGRLPQIKPVKPHKIAEVKYDHFILEKLTLELNGLEPVPAYFIRPHETKEKAPAILYSHVHGGGYEKGKEELVSGWPSLQDPPWAEEIASRGWCALAIDSWNFGERHNRTESSLFKEMLWNGRVLWGMMVFDALRALDYLCSREEVDANRIAALGMSMGSTLSWWAAALDERITVCVHICCLTDFQSLVKNKSLDQHGLYYYVPDLLNHFTTAEINALIAPRPHLSLAGNKDALTPPEGLDRIDEHLKKVYEKASVPNAWKLHRENVAHTETPAMRKEAIEWLEKWL